MNFSSSGHILAKGVMFRSGLEINISTGGNHAWDCDAYFEWYTTFDDLKKPLERCKSISQTRPNLRILLLLSIAARHSSCRISDDDNGSFFHMSA